MAQAKLQGQGSPKGIKRAFYRTPIWFYRAKLGFLLGHRFVMIETVGRKSGKTRQVVLEVVADEPDSVYIASAWGERAHWLQNMKANPAVTVHLGRSVYESEAEMIDSKEAHRVLSEYAELHPKALAGLSRYMLEDPGETTQEQVDRVTEVIPFVRLPKPPQS